MLVKTDQLSRGELEAECPVHEQNLANLLELGRNLPSQLAQ